jgi:hypothetical protein
MHQIVELLLILFPEFGAFIMVTLVFNNFLITLYEVSLEWSLDVRD